MLIYTLRGRGEVKVPTSPNHILQKVLEDNEEFNKVKQTYEQYATEEWNRIKALREVYHSTIDKCFVHPNEVRIYTFIVLCVPFTPFSLTTLSSHSPNLIGYPRIG